MNRIALIAAPLLALTLAGCASTGPTQVAQAPVVMAPVTPQPLVASPAQTTQQALLTTSVANGFVEVNVGGSVIRMIELSCCWLTNKFPSASSVRI